jgi:hypothetical protein
LYVDLQVHQSPIILYEIIVYTLHNFISIMAPSNNDSLKSKAEASLKKNPTALGDPVSLKAETSDTKPTEKDQPNSGSATEEKRSLKEMAQSNPTMLGDPVSLKAETSDTEPTPDDRGALGTQKEQKRQSKI